MIGSVTRRLWARRYSSSASPSSSEVEADSRSTSTDADAIQFTRAGIATGLVSVPNRYMHSPNEIVDLEDLTSCARLIAAYIKSLKKDTDFIR